MCRRHNSSRGRPAPGHRHCSPPSTTARQEIPRPRHLPTTPLCTWTQPSPQRAHTHSNTPTRSSAQTQKPDDKPAVATGAASRNTTNSGAHRRRHHHPTKRPAAEHPQLHPAQQPAYRLLLLLLVLMAVEASPSLCSPGEPALLLLLLLVQWLVPLIRFIAGTLSHILQRRVLGSHWGTPQVRSVIPCRRQGSSSRAAEQQFASSVTTSVTTSVTICDLSHNGSYRWPKDPLACHATAPDGQL